MSKLRRILFLVLSVAALAVMLLLLLTRPANDWRGWRRLPDGSRIKILATSYGRTNFTWIEFKKGWQFLEPVLPKSIAGKLGLRHGGLGVSNGATNSLYLVMDHAGIPPAAALGLELAVLGNRGERFEARSRAGTSTPGDPTEARILWEIPVFPRREKVIRLVALKQQSDGTWTTIAEFDLPNPCHGPFPVWKPDALPDEYVSGSLKVALVSVVSGPDETDSAGVRGLARTTYLRLHIAEGTVGWVLRQLTFSDATGNICVSPGTSWQFSPAAKEVNVGARGGLPLDEPAWKVTAEFVQLESRANKSEQFEFLVKPAEAPHDQGKSPSP